MAAATHAGALCMRDGEVCMRLPPGSEAGEQAWAHVNELHRAVVDAPAAGVVGVMIKAYLLIHDCDDGWREDSAALSRDSQDWQGLLKDAVRFVPELAPLAANVLKGAEDVDGEEENIELDGVVSRAGKREWMGDSEERLAETFRKIHARSRLGYRPDVEPEILGFGEPEAQRLD
jgi:hypothetical protein